MLAPAAKWDQRFLGLAQHVAAWSKDPSTKVGAVIVHADRTIASIGYNGFPRGVRDEEIYLSNRPTRLARTVHAEANAILTAGGGVWNCTLYVWPFPPCSACAGLIIQAGLGRVVAPAPSPELAERWSDSLEVARQLFLEARVLFDLVETTRALDSK